VQGLARASAGGSVIGRFPSLGPEGPRVSVRDWLAGPLARTRSARKEALRTRILREAQRQGIRVVDLSAGAMLRLSFCVARRSLTEPLPMAVAHCLGQRAGRLTRRHLRPRRYRKAEVLEELRRQQVDLTNASAGWMLRLMACVSAQALSRSLPDAVSVCLLSPSGRRYRRRRARLGRW
jgi:hypothetical protein